MRTARRILVLANVAEFRMRSKQLSLGNSRLIKAATARSNVAEEWVSNLSQQGIAHRKELGIQLIQIEAARHHVHSMIAYVGQVEYVVRCGRILDSVRPLLGVIGLAVARDRGDGLSHIGQTAQ